MNSKLHVVCDSKGRPIQMYLSAGQTSDYVGAAGLLRLLPPVKCLLERVAFNLFHILRL